MDIFLLHVPVLFIITAKKTSDARNRGVGSSEA
jgi:hypothetical protein